MSINKTTVELKGMTTPELLKHKKLMRQTVADIRNQLYQLEYTWRNLKVELRDRVVENELTIMELEILRDIDSALSVQEEAALELQ